MKPATLFLMLLLTLAVRAQQPEVTIEGSFARTPPVKWVIVMFQQGDVAVKDTIRVQNGAWKYKRPLPGPVLANIVYRSDSALRQFNGMGIKQYNFPLYLQPGRIEIETRDSVQGNAVKGSRAHTDYLALQAAAQRYENEFQQGRLDYMKARRANDTATQRAIETRMQALEKEQQERVYGAFVKEQPGSPLALYALQKVTEGGLDPAVHGPLFERFPKATRESPEGKAFAATLATARKTAVGQPAMNFTMNDTLDRPVALASFKGRYVLLDFWASWCGPCRQENPNVVRVYQKYKERNFTVLGVSLDRPGARDKWLGAIRADGLTWTHVSDLKFWDNAAAKQYGIQFIPQNFLLDPNGVIIAKNLNGEDLEKKLAEVLPPVPQRGN
ncbi:TlpA disulfide reductase family protein [Flaviaesturariibacter amylovorans]|uniref:Thioredoxin domain-containing protein n=1 Tax=Flaviaesturariibacter amylovorans TaxID=1084520 RepID=A0ABP8H9W8_9BACT